jgi:plastocyanin
MLRLALVGMSLAGFAAACGGGGSGGGYGGGMGGGGTTPPSTPTTGCTATTATATTSISLSGMTFVPSCVKVSPGAMVTFQNADSVTHIVASDPGQPESFDSGDLLPRQDYMHTFVNSAETVHIHCRIHTYMTATIIVQ